MPEEARRRSSAVSADGRYLSLGSGSAAPVVVEVQHSAVVEYPLEGEVDKRRAAVERYKAESLAHRQAIFDWNGKILDLIADGVLDQEEAKGLFRHPGVTADERIPYTTDGKWHAIYPPLPKPPPPEQQQKKSQGPATAESIHQAFTRFFLQDLGKGSSVPSR